MTVTTNYQPPKELASLANATLTPSNVKKWLQSPDLTIESLKPYIKPPGVFAYERSLMYQTPELEILTMTWAYNRPCNIHDHSQSEGFVKIIKGSLVNDDYKLENNGSLVQIAQTTHYEGELIYFPKDTIHRMRSISPRTITVHVYFPAITGMQVFDPVHDLKFTVSDDCGAWFPKNEEQILKVSNLA